MLGAFPKTDVDHVNNIKTDNSWKNLRLASKAENQHNKDKLRSNTTGVKGVSWIKTRKCYRAQVKIDYKPYVKEFYPSQFGSKKEALTETTRDITNLRERLHKEFANHGVVQGCKENGIVPGGYVDVR